MRLRRKAGFFVFLLAAVVVTLQPSLARTISVVTFQSERGIVIIDSRDSKAAYRLFESLNVPVVSTGIRQTKIFAPPDGSFRIACSAVSTDYHCAVVVYASEYANLDFDTDRVELNLPATVAKTYIGIFQSAADTFYFATEDGRLVLEWSPAGLHILGERPLPGEKI